MNKDDDYSARQKVLVDELEESFLGNQHRSSVIDIQPDYANDQQICLTSVAFIPDKLANTIIKQVSEPLSSIEPSHYFYANDSLHLTIKNVKMISNPPLFNQADIDKVDNLFQALIPRFSEFEFDVEDVLLFPTSIAVMAYSSIELQRLILALDEGLRSIGVPDDKKYLSASVFWGNITVCRFNHEPGKELVKAVKQMRKSKIGKFKIREIDLVTCNSVCHPSSRKIIAKYRLGH